MFGVTCSSGKYGVIYHLVGVFGVCVCVCAGAEVTILQSVFVSPVAGRMYFK